tara:strand:- start:826 stop:1617 length:792 start_codon:yes stop_codon:yes gene_type:complete
MYQIKSPKNISINDIKKFFINLGLGEMVKQSAGPEQKVNEMTISNPYKPDLKDLYRLYFFIISNKRTTVMEFGSGWSSLVMALALSELCSKYSKDILKLRRNNPFELFIVENEKKFLNITKKRLKKFKNKINIKINYFYTDVLMTMHNGFITTKYKKLPICNPDFIYLDGPDQFNVKGNCDGISIRHIDMMPMNSDILKIEYFLVPGTIIIVDGRGANSIFLKNNFQRKWFYKYDKIFDQHVFALNDPSIGRYNDLLLKFYKK